MKRLECNGTDRTILIDDEDYEIVAQYRWRLHSNESYPCANIDRRPVFLHNLLYPDGEYDHIDRNGFNNQRCNLRPCTRSQNLANRTKIQYTNMSSQYKGVSWHTGVNKWQARICKNYKQIHLGYFDREEDAAKAYDAKAVEWFGEFALCNFPS